MKRNWKRLTALLLSFVLLCGGLPVLQGNATAAAVSGEITPVTAEVAAKDAVFSAEAQVVYVGEVGGEDYMFIFMNDYKLLVYNLDTQTLTDTQEGSGLFMQPRGAVMDSTGILWACGLGNWLYRYDPVAKTGQKIPFSKSLFAGISTLNITGITVDENDTVYFGTANKGYYGRYDGETVSCISPWLDPVNTADPDSFYSGYGGLVVREGYIYSCLEGDNNADGNNTHYFVKYDIANQKIVSYIDVAPYLGEKAGQYRQVTDLGGNYVMLSSNAKMSAPVIVDISTMMRVEFSNWEEQTGTYGFAAVADDGSVYVTARLDSSGLFKITLPATTGGTASVEKLFEGQQLPKMLCRGGGWATVDGEQVIVTYNNNDGNDTVEAVFYNVQTGSMTAQTNVTKGNGSGNQLRSIATDPDRKNIYVGSYGTDRLAQYTVAEGAVTEVIGTYAEQTDSLLWYDGYLYAGNYSECTVTQVDVENGTAQPFFRLNGTMFDQYRAHALAAGDSKVFLGTVPSSSNNGGVLAWYDLETAQTYVAAGPTAADVYTAQTVGVSVSKYQWTNVAAGTVTTQLDVTGVIENQTVNCIVYKDGLLYGTTSVYGGSGSEKDTANAKLFVYDVEQMMVLAVLDLATVMEGFVSQIEWVDVIAEDPMEPGKFWGVVADTLFSFTFDGTAFSVREELSLGKDTYNGTGNVWDHRNIIFDGSYMYVVLPQTGVYMVDRNDPQSYVLLSGTAVKQMAMGEDGNLYFFNSSEEVNADLQVLKVAQYTQPLVAAAAQSVIDGLPNAVTAENISQFNAAEKLYKSLLPIAQAQVDTTALYVARPYQVGTAVYTDIADAIHAAAQSGKQIRLTENARADSVLLTDGVTLDLNGFTLTAGAFNANVLGVAEGFVVDSSTGNAGMLCTERSEDLFQVNNPDLPAYDAAAGGYRFFDYKLELHTETENVGVGKEKFWFRFHFYTDDTCTAQDQDAYSLIQADGSNLEFSTDISWQGSLLRTVSFGLADENNELKTERFCAKWAEGATLSRWLYITVSGLDKVGEGVLEVTPVITVNGVEATNGTLRYEKEGITPDYGWSEGGPY